MNDDLLLRLVVVLEKLERHLAAADEELITLEEAARRLGGCSIRTVWRKIHAGELRAVRHGKYTRVAAESVSSANGVVRYHRAR